MDEDFGRNHGNTELIGAEPAAQPRRGGKKVLVIESDPAIGELLKAILEDEVGCETEWMRDIPEDTDSPWYEVFLQQPRRPDLVLVDLSLVFPYNTLQLESLAEQGVNLPPLVVMSDSPPDHAQQQAERVNAVGLVTKPFEIDTLLGAVNDILRSQT